MRKLLTIVALTLTINAVAQEHLTFNWIPIDGTVEEMASRLVNSGFEDLTVLNDGKKATLSGTFLGVENCEITLLGSPKTKTCFSVIVRTKPYGRDLNGLLNFEYYPFKKSLSEKYATAMTPPLYKEVVRTDKLNNSDDISQALKDGKIEFISLFNRPNGFIKLIIKPVTSSYLADNYTEIGFVDKVNYAIFEEEK